MHFSGQWKGWIRPKGPSNPESHLQQWPIAHIYHYAGQKVNRDQFSVELQICQTPGKSKSPNPKTVMHGSYKAKACSFLLTIFPPVNYYCIPWFFSTSLTSIYIWSHGQQGRNMSLNSQEQFSSSLAPLHWASAEVPRWGRSWDLG